MNAVQIKIGIGIAIILASVAWMAMTSFEQAKSLYIFTNELTDMKEDAYNKRLKIAGIVEEGTINREDGKIHFTLGYEGVTIPVVYVGTGPLPDTFKGGSEAVAEGIYRRDNIFEAEHIQAKCASKYEADYESIRGVEEAT